MCGIAGILLGSSRSRRWLDSIEPMLDTMTHRGPDGAGAWIDRDAGLALGHRRLAIIDLTDAGRQPMLSESRRLVITFNGEIYNFGDIRRELASLGRRFRGGSDTEVMLNAIECWGLDAALRRFAGMFAFALWDRDARILHLARDRIGKKPLFVAQADGAIAFASELKAIRAFPGFSGRIDPDAAAAMLANGATPDNACIWSNVFKIAPGTSLSLSADDAAASMGAEQMKRKTRVWWSLADVAAAGRRHVSAASDRDNVEELDRLLRLTTSERMVADVPLGAFLSGGIDSSTVVALMQAQSNRPVRTFTIGFGERGFDESGDARRIAQHLGTDHTELRLTPGEARKVIPELATIWDEPFADVSQIPTLLVSRLARTGVTVALTGDGGDECFGGYTRHFLSARLAPLLAAPAAVRRAAAAALRLLCGSGGERALARLPLTDGLRRSLRGDRLQRLASMIEADGDCAMYRALTRLSVPLAREQVGTTDDAHGLDDMLSRFIFRDMTGYLRDDILVKLDRASMAASLEARCPFLDHRVIEFAWRLPNACKVRNGKGKWILREVLTRYVPRMLFERPKQGFDVPIGEWLKGPLRSWAEDLLAPARLARQDLIDAPRLRACWQSHLDGRFDHSHMLWAVLMFQAWLDEANTAPAFKSPAVPEAALPGSL